MARHATPSPYSPRGTRSRTPRPAAGTPIPRTTAPAGLTSSASVLPKRIPVSTSGRILVAAVAAGAALPAVQTLGTHIADAESTSTAELNSADLSLAAAHGPTVRPAATHSAPGHRAGWSSVTPVVAGDSSDDDETSSSSSRSGSPSAGDADDLSSLTKAMRIERENGPPDFGTPYSAGNEDSLNGQIAKALGLMGLPQKLAPGVKKIIMRESTGNADAVNDWDSNAAAGTPSKGLMQLIDTTFKNAVLPSLADKGIFDPVANITAGVRTMIANHSIDDVVAGGLKNSSGNYIGYGGSKLPDDGLG